MPKSDYADTAGTCHVFCGSSQWRTIWRSWHLHGLLFVLWNRNTPPIAVVW